MTTDKVAIPDHNRSHRNPDLRSRVAAQHRSPYITITTQFNVQSTANNIGPCPPTACFPSPDGIGRFRGRLDGSKDGGKDIVNYIRVNLIEN